MFIGLIFDKNKNVTCAIGAGGRYDKIITNFINDGNSYPAVGMSFGLVPICEILNKNKDNTDNYLYDLYIIPMSSDEEVEALKLANRLREHGIRVIIEMKRRKIKKAMEWANKNNIPYVVVIGGNEVELGLVEIKDMNNYSTNRVSINDIGKMIGIIKK